MERGGQLLFYRDYYKFKLIVGMSEWVSLKKAMKKEAIQKEKETVYQMYIED